MSEKPEAIRLAEWIEEDMSCLGDAEIAAELRRMHAELQIAHNKNNELQEALQQIKPHATQPAEMTDEQREYFLDGYESAQRDAIACRIPPTGFTFVAVRIDDGRL